MFSKFDSDSEDPSFYHHLHLDKTYHELLDQSTFNKKLDLAISLSHVASL